ncbi:MAG: DNA-binding response regulator [Cyanobacteria bacterium J055]|nr:MAG: DNA-binding response regulator [Cyanobacteria bacterium J055]
MKVAQEFRQVRETSENPNLKLCLLLASDRLEEIRMALAAGVQSYCLKTSPIERLAEAIRRTHAGYFYLDPAIALQLLGWVRERESEAILTQPELEVLASLAAGSTDEAIAQNLGTNVETVKTHIANILDRLYVSDWVQRAVKV